ncbi:MAG: hypothetical protein GXO74_14020 [Calditrichaeota bacterium]|nr:hypothetical protein [Calditrichota bacterium]
MNTLNDQQLKIGELPKLQIMPIANITFHEEPDEERSGKLIEYLRKENKLKNPPVVATYGKNNHYILLDGANRITALRRLQIPDVLAQVIDLFDEGLIFLHWRHAVEHFSKREFVDKLRQIPSIKINRMAAGTLQSNENGDLLCQILFGDGSLYAVRAHSDLFQRVEDLKQITALYKGSYYMDRVSYTNLQHLKHNYPDFCALVVFREFTKEELVQLTEKKILIPSGITRVILPKRALRVNAPLDILRFDVSIDQKNHWLQKRINEQISDKSIRFYHEPTFLFDE